MKTIREINVAVIGAGRMGRIRAHACASQGANVVSICDTSEQRATELANDFNNCKPITSEAEVPWNSIDAIFVCTPPIHRGPIELAALSRKLPFFLEKPIAVSAQQIAAVANQLQSNPQLSVVGYQNRHRASLRHAKDIIQNENVLGFSARWVGGPYNVPWWSKTSESGGAVNEQATHLLDMGRFLLGEVVSVHAMSSRTPSTSCTISLEFANGALGSIFYSYGHADKSIGMNIFTSKRTLTLNGWDFRFEGENLNYPEGDPETAHRNAIFELEVNEFLEAVESGNSSTSLCDFIDAYETQQLVDQVVAKLGMN